MDYATTSGKNLIIKYIDGLPKKERFEGYKIRQEINKYGLAAFDKLNTRQLRGKLWEIKFSANRIMYIIQDAESVYFLHTCQKQKGKRIWIKGRLTPKYERSPHICSLKQIWKQKLEKCKK
jgi:phage-related protein